MDNQNFSIDLSKIPKKSAGSQTDGEMNTERLASKNAYIAVIGISFALTCFLYYIFMKNESEKDIPRIIVRPAMEGMEFK